MPTTLPAYRPLRQRLDWTVILSIGALHLVALAAPWCFSWSALVLMLLLIWITGGLGVTLGFHRLLTHRSFRCPRWLEYTLAMLGCLALQGSPVQWVGTHRLHHAQSDTDLDPHTPRHGFTWAHMFWCMIHSEHPERARIAAGDLQRDPFLRQLDRFFWVPAVLLAVALGWLGGWSWFVWGVALRTVLVYHGTWLVNSAAHTWGYRSYATTDNSRNTWWIALLSFGEGWHNNHHAFQRSAAHGLKWWEFDLTYLTILVLQRLGLAWGVVKPSTFARTRKALRDQRRAPRPVPHLSPTPLVNT